MHAHAVNVSSQPCSLPIERGSIWGLGYRYIRTWPLFCPTPCRVTTLGCLNWAMMAASWRNLIRSASLASCLRVLIATCTVCSGRFQLPSSTVPNCPEPSFFPNLQNRKMTVSIAWSRLIISLNVMLNPGITRIFSLFNSEYMADSVSAGAW